MAFIHLSIDGHQQSNQHREQERESYQKDHSLLFHWFQTVNQPDQHVVVDAPKMSTSHDRCDDDYDWTRSTEYNHRAVTGKDVERIAEYQGQFGAVRQQFLDHSYHSIYTPERQALQDTIMEGLLKESAITVTDTETGQECQVALEPWIIFTAGVYGAGKTHTIKRLHEKGQFPLKSFVAVDPDEIRRQLPEFPMYIERTPERAGELTRKEAGMMAEIVTNYALEQGKNVLVDGSLKDAEWYKNYFQKLRQHFPNIKIGIIHVTAPMEAILYRVQERAKLTGRVVPMEALQRSFQEVPTAVQELRNVVDYFIEIYNPPESVSHDTAATTTTTTVTTTIPSSSDEAIANTTPRQPSVMPWRQQDGQPQQQKTYIMQAIRSDSIEVRDVNGVFRLQCGPA